MDQTPAYPVACERRAHAGRQLPAAGTDASEKNQLVKTRRFGVDAIDLWFPKFVKRLVPAAHV